MKGISSLLLTAALAAACVSTSSVGYGDGFVTTSPVTYQYEAPPVLQSARGRTYRVTGDVGQRALPVFEQAGMRLMQGPTEVEVAINLGKVEQGEPGAMKLGNGYVPAFTVTVPYEVAIRADGQVVAQSRDKYENVLTFKGGKTFQTREQATAAIDTIRKLAEQGLEQRARENATTAAFQSANETAGRLFDRRTITVEVPVVRSAAGVDLEACYTQLAEAADPAALRQALQSYEQSGMTHSNEDGSPNETANYGVACGIAAARLLLGDLQGAWDATRTATGFEPEGQEADQIRLVIYRQEKATGVAVIPAADRARIEEAERASSALQRLFATPNR